MIELVSQAATQLLRFGQYFPASRRAARTLDRRKLGVAALRPDLSQISEQASGATRE
jgi:hypothetical protein